MLCVLRGDRSCFGANQMALLVNNMPANAGYPRDQSSVPELERSPRGGKGNPLWYSCLENLMDKGVGGLHSMRS